MFTIKDDVLYCGDVRIGTRADVTRALGMKSMPNTTSDFDLYQGNTLASVCLGRSCDLEMTVEGSQVVVEYTSHEQDVMIASKTAPSQVLDYLSTV